MGLIWQPQALKIMKTSRLNPTFMVPSWLWPTQLFSQQMTFESYQRRKALPWRKMTSASYHLLVAFGTMTDSQEACHRFRLTSSRRYSTRYITQSSASKWTIPLARRYVWDERTKFSYDSDAFQNLVMQIFDLPELFSPST